MVTMTEEKKRVLNYREVKAEYDGHWVLFDHRDFPPEDDMGYVVAYGDGSDEDRDALREINHSKYNGEVVLIKGWVPKDDDIFDSGIIEMV
jgi:hypothetical protein